MAQSLDVLNAQLEQCQGGHASHASNLASLDAMPSKHEGNRTSAMAQSVDDLTARPEQFPCSLGQRRFWSLDQLDPGNPALNVAVRWRLEGGVSIPQLERAFQVIIARHAVLRTSIATVDGEPVQIVEPRLA